MTSEKALSKLSDAQLVQCFSDGNNSCFREIVTRYHTKVHNVLHYKLHNAVWEKDAEQETFIVLALNIRDGTYHDTGHLGQYLKGVAWVQADIILRKEHHYVHDDTALRGDEQKEEPQEEIFSERNADTVLLRFAMKKLSPRHREALQLRDIYELSFQDIGLRMNISEVTARTTYFKAKSRLKQIMENIRNERREEITKRKGG